MILENSFDTEYGASTSPTADDGTEQFELVVDVNLDGQISASENVFAQTWEADWTTIAAANAGSNAIGAAGFVDYSPAEQALMDSDGDGDISKIEFMAYESYVYRFD